MDQTAVIPDQNVADAPFMIITVLILRDRIVDPIKQRVAFRPPHIDDPIRPVRVEIERLRARILMGPDQRMDDLRRLGFFLLGSLLRAGVGAHRVVGMDGKESFDPLLVRIRQLFIGLARIAELRVPTDIRNLD